MFRRFLMTAAGLVVVCTAVSAAPVTQRLRGTVESTAAGTVTVKTNDGKTVAITLAPDTKFGSVVKSSLDAVKDGVFIGTATKGDNPPTALEVVVFPESMRGTGEGHYDWDTIVDTTATTGKSVSSAMTNGTIKATSKPVVKSAMTNGTVKSGTAGGGSKMLTVTYSDGKSIAITVPPTAPIVSVEPADLSVLTPGAKVFAVVAVDGEKRDGKRFLVGKDGVTPPM